MCSRQIRDLKGLAAEYSKRLAVGCVEAYPEGLVHEGRAFLKELASHSGREDLGVGSEMRRLLEKVLPLSMFLRTVSKRRPEFLAELSREDLWYRCMSMAQMGELADRFTRHASHEDDFAERLRLFRHLMMLRIAVRDIGGIADFFETSSEITDLARVCLERCVRFSERIMEQRFGRAKDADGRNQRLIVIGMGKLGARELNFSSDIDIVFSFRDPGTTKGGEKSISNEEYFLVQARKIIQLLAKNTPWGFVFRVDTRLRPFGDSGPLVMSCEAMAEYYENHGRSWERYAMVKAAPVAGDMEGGRRLIEILRPFVYRKYIDYSAIEALKDMKAMILAEQAGKTVRDNVKLGPGGIRDIEFIVQAFQLLRGGRIKALQTPSMMKALQVIQELGFLDIDTCRRLAESYVFLRTAENRLQEYADMQTQCLPRDEDRRRRLALSMGFEEWSSFLGEYQKRTGVSEAVFKGLFEEREDEVQGRDMQPTDAGMLHAVFVWANPEDDRAAEALGRLGFEEPEEMASLLAAFKRSARVRSLSGQVHQLLDSLMPKLLVASARSGTPDKAFREGLSIFEAVLRRSIYLVLLDQNPPALEHLVYLCGRSRLVSQLLRRQPILLDELVSADSLFASASEQDLARILSATMDALSRRDLEHWLDELRRFKKANVLRTAASQLKGVITVEEVGSELAALARVLLAEVFQGAWKDFSGRAPDFVQGRDIHGSGLSIVAYGRFGSREMNYFSDLDLVFLYDPAGFGPLGPAQRSQLGYFYSRLVQRLIFFLSTRTSQGILYEIDTRLRPNGSQGVLVSTIDTFDEYQRTKAWTWEHQALVKARFVAGDPACGSRFEETRRQVLAMERDCGRLRADIMEMRSKIQTSAKTGEGLFHLKKSPGGLVDIEFMVQYLVLSHAHREPELAGHRGTKNLIARLGEYGFISMEQARLLEEAFHVYQERLCLRALDLEEPVVPSEELDEVRKGVLETWDKVFS